MHYRVVWEIDVDADTPEEAARKARQMQEKGTTALFFEVQDTAGTKTQVELPPES